MTLRRYVLMAFMRALLAVQGAIAIVVGLFAAVENLQRLRGEGATLMDVLRITMLQMPETLYQIFPLVLMLASLVTFLRLAQHSELVVMRASALSALRLILVPMGAATLLGAGFVAALNPFVAASIEYGATLEEGFGGAGLSRLSFSDDGLWLRQADAEGQTVIQAARANFNGTLLSQIRLHRFDEDGGLYARIEAPVARLGTRHWVLEGATRWRRDGAGRFVRIETRTRIDLPTSLTSAKILESFSRPETIGFWDLDRFIVQMEDAGFSARAYRLFRQSELAKPALFAAMVLIGSAFALRPARFGKTGVMIMLAVLAGFALFFLKDFAESLGASGEVPLVVAAWIPPLAAISLALGLLLHLEDG